MHRDGLGTATDRHRYVLQPDSVATGEGRSRKPATPLLVRAAERLPPYTHIIILLLLHFVFSCWVSPEQSRTFKYTPICRCISSYYLIYYYYFIYIYLHILHSVSCHEHFPFSASVFPNPKTPAPSPGALNKCPLTALITCSFMKILAGEFPAPAGEGSRDQQMQRLWGTSHCHSATTGTGGSGGSLSLSSVFKSGSSRAPARQPQSQLRT